MLHSVPHNVVFSTLKTTPHIVPLSSSERTLTQCRPTALRSTARLSQRISDLLSGAKQKVRLAY